MEFLTIPSNYLQTKFFNEHFVDFNLRINIIFQYIKEFLKNYKDLNNYKGFNFNLNFLQILQ